MAITTIHSALRVLVPLAIVAVGCAEGEPDDVDPVEEAGEVDDDLTAEEIAAIDSRVIASLEVDEMGCVDIVDAGIDGDPWYVLVSVGGKGVHDVVDQLERQQATPAEVFLALAPPELALPDALVRDH